jgi:hypothetical protein
MRYLKTYRIFEASQAAKSLSDKQEEFLNKYTKGTWTYDPATGLVDVNGNFNCSGRRLKTLSGIKFGKVSGNFFGYENSLTSLEGAPQEVGGDFDCSVNKLTSLEGAPQIVRGNFKCSKNALTSLKGAPQRIGEGFYCTNNSLTSLVGAPQEVGEDFHCYKNSLTSLVGSPQKVSRDFICSDNLLTSLKGAPQEVGGNFFCWDNKLISLEGAPKDVSGKFYCEAFKLDAGEWNPKGWAKISREGSQEAQELILTLFSAELLNSEIQKDPAGTIMKLKVVWNDQNFREIRSKLIWPKGYEDEADLVGDLGGIGF